MTLNQFLKRKAFTLVELIVVVVVLGIIAALAVGTFATVRSNSAENIALRSAEQVVRNAESIGAFKGEVLSGTAGNTNIDIAGSELETGNGATYDASSAETYAGKVTINVNGECAEAIIENNGGITAGPCGTVNAGGGGAGGGPGGVEYWIYEQVLGAPEDSTVSINSGVRFGQLITAPGNGAFTEIQLFIGQEDLIDITAELYEVTSGNTLSYGAELIQVETFLNIDPNGQVSLDTPSFATETGKQYIVTVRIDANQPLASVYNATVPAGYVSSNGSTFTQLAGNLGMNIEYTP